MRCRGQSAPRGPSRVQEHDPTATAGNRGGRIMSTATVDRYRKVGGADIAKETRKCPVTGLPYHVFTEPDQPAVTSGVGETRIVLKGEVRGRRWMQSPAQKF